MKTEKPYPLHSLLLLGLYETAQIFYADEISGWFFAGGIIERKLQDAG